MQWSIVSEALDCSTHPDGCHSKGMLLGSEGGHSVSVHHNLFAHNEIRNPQASSACGTPDEPAQCLTDVRGNVIYNWGKLGKIGRAHV